MKVKFSKFPDDPKFRPFHAFGFGVILSGDVFKGISLLIGFWQLNIGWWE